MTRARAAGRESGRAVQSPATLDPARLVAALAVLVALAALAAACGPSTPTASPGTSPAGSPGASGGAGGARPTPWPGNAVLGMEALGLADGQIGAAMTDLSRGVSDEDLSLMREAAAGLAGLEVLLPSVDKIRQEPGMVSFGDRYEAAITKIDDAATRLRDAIDEGDAPAISTATRDVLSGMADYTALQGELAAWLEQMPEQKRMFVQ